jgi:ElaB/YqjD/DUF883 family membrane-anchored ribosome-binding protein
MRVTTEKCQNEMVELREKSSKELTELRSEVEHLTKELHEKSTLAALQKEQLVSPRPQP